MKTEKKNPRSAGIDMKGAAEVLRIIHKEESSVSKAVGKKLGVIARAVDYAVSTIRGGGKVFYIGAGTSGRLGVLDASEIPPTFGETSFKAIIAGGKRAVTDAVEGAEDDTEAGERAASKIGKDDMVVGISASGKTPFVISALKAAKRMGAKCWLISCNEADYLFLDGIILLDTGPEVIAGSTRMKAATATKMALNMLSTTTMIRLGHVYDGLMIDVRPTNKKLVKRAEDIIMSITGCEKKAASKYLRLSGMRPKVAVLMVKKGLSKKEAEGLLDKSDGSLRKAMN